MSFVLEDGWGQGGDVKDKNTSGHEGKEKKKEWSRCLGKGGTDDVFIT